MYRCPACPCVCPLYQYVYQTSLSCVYRFFLCPCVCLVGLHALLCISYKMSLGRIHQGLCVFHICIVCDIKASVYIHSERLVCMSFLCCIRYKGLCLCVLRRISVYVIYLSLSILVCILSAWPALCTEYI